MMWEWKMLAPPVAMLGVFRIVPGNRSWIRHMRIVSLFMLIVLTVSAWSYGDMGTSQVCVGGEHCHRWQTMHERCVHTPRHAATPERGGHCRFCDVR